jgi:hypothetical protein
VTLPSVASGVQLQNGRMIVLGLEPPTFDAALAGLGIRPGRQRIGS